MKHRAAVFDGAGFDRFHVHAVLIGQIGDVEKTGVNADGTCDGGPLGDNMLASGAILDYGSIRQFAAKHDKYRYDDVDRFSSSLTEQRFWARELVKAFAQVSQKAFAACVKDAEPCLAALTQSASGLDLAQQRNQWNRVKELMRDPTTMKVALGAFDADRMQRDYQLVATYFSLEHPFDVGKAYTDEFLDPNIKMSADGAR